MATENINCNCKYAEVSFPKDPWGRNWVEEIDEGLIGAVKTGDEVVVSIQRRSDGECEKLVGTVVKLMAANPYGTSQLGAIIALVPDAESIAERRERAARKAAAIAELEQAVAEDELLRAAARAAGVGKDEIRGTENARIANAMRELAACDPSNAFAKDVERLVAAAAEA